MSATSRLYLVTPAKFGVLAAPALVLAGQVVGGWLCGREAAAGNVDAVRGTEKKRQ